MATALDQVQPDVELESADAKNTMTPERLAAIAAAAKRLRENPLFNEYLASIEEYRREHNTVPDSE